MTISQSSNFISKFLSRSMISEEMPDDLQRNTENTCRMHRMQSLRDALSLTIQKTASSAKLSKFQSSLLRLHQSNPEAVKQFSKQVAKEIESSMQEEIALLFAEEKIEENLNALDRMESQQMEENPANAWRPSGEPEQDGLPLRINVKRKQKDRLVMMISQLENHHKLLAEHVAIRKEKLISTKEETLKVFEKWHELSDELDTFPVQDMIQLTRNFCESHTDVV